MKTLSEEIFEKFLAGHGLPFEKIKTALTPRPDYLVIIGALKLIFEIKELTADEDFRSRTEGKLEFAASRRTIGNHVRSAIGQASKQIQYGAKQLKLPSILLIYNKINPFFGTEDHDFTAAMYGEPTLLISLHTKTPIGEVFHGRNASLRNKNTSFSAVGRISAHGEETVITLFENTYASVPIAYEQLPSYLRVIRVKIDSSPL